MTASTTDPQSPATLPSLSEALDITVTTDPLTTVISVLYPSGAWDMVYQDGAFAQKYAASTRVGSAFALRRVGGWPPGVQFQPKVYEPPAVPTGGQTWGAIYQADLTAQSSQTMTAAGSYTIDSKTWWAKGTLWPSGVCGLVNGSGLRLYGPSGDIPTNRPRFRSDAGAVSYRVLWFPFTQLADYNPDAPTYVAWRMTGTVLDMGTDNVPCAGMGSFAASSSSLSGTEKDSCIQVDRRGHNNASATYAGKNPGATVTSTIVNDNVRGNYQDGVLWFARNRLCAFGFHAWSGSFLTPENSANQYSSSVCYQESDLYANRGFFFSIHKPFNEATELDVYLTHFAVMQPRVP